MSTARLKEKYRAEVVPALMKQYSYKSVMQVPRLEKIVINVGLGEAIQNAKLLDAVVAEVRDISGQSVLVTRARKSIASFKLRAGMPIGCTVTLRRDRMYEFLDRLVNASVPRIRDFKGVSPKSFDGRGNYSLGIKEQIIFPEIDYDKVEAIHGMDITFVTSAKTDDEGRSLLKLMGMPFRA